MAEELGQLYHSLEQRVEDRTQQIQIASEVARAVISISNLDELLRQGVQLIKERFGYDHVSIFLLDREGTNAILRETSSDDKEALKTIGHKLKVGSKSVVGWVTETNVPRLSSDLSAGTKIELDELLPGARSEVAIPLQVAGNPLGALAIQSMQANAFTSEDIEVLQTLADQLSAAIENVRLAQESTNAAERARLVSEITAQISGLMEPEKVLQVTAQALHKALGDAEIMIRLVSPEEEVLKSKE
jgi:GAF domain-containing protein